MLLPRLCELHVSGEGMPKGASLEARELTSWCGLLCAQRSLGLLLGRQQGRERPAETARGAGSEQQWCPRDPGWRVAGSELSLVSGKPGAGLGYDSQVSGWKRWRPLGLMT